jgi:hypothetical protein
MVDFDDSLYLGQNSGASAGLSSKAFEWNLRHLTAAA